VGNKTGVRKKRKREKEKKLAWRLPSSEKRTSTAAMDNFPNTSCRPCSLRSLYARPSAGMTVTMPGFTLDKVVSSWRPSGIFAKKIDGKQAIESIVYNKTWRFR
jgi:hypothetical protein